ncbi:MAG: hypothetical protein ACFFEY_15040 [Candidatus Thorarchaeota archaeon]
MSEFPQKCIKCKRTDLPLNKFVYARSVMSRYIKTRYIKIPVCDNCEKDFMKYEKILKYLRLKYCLMCIFTITLFLTLAWIISAPYLNGMIILTVFVISIISGVLTLILLVIHLNLYYKNTGRINKYIEIKMDGSILIKDPEYRKEYEEFLAFRAESSKEESQENTFYCPKCHRPQKRGTLFCKNCGKDLREFS